MKKIKIIFKTLFVLFVIVACTDNLRDISFIDAIAPPTNVSATFDITQDNTGLVTISPTADGATSFMIYFGDNKADPVEVVQGNNVEHTYAEGSYDVKIVAVNLKGEEAEATQQLVVSFKAPENLEVVIENDAAISKQVNITANADFATMFEFDSGETGVTQPVVTGNIGETISYQYQTPGVYSVKITAKGGAIATTEYTEDFEVTEILAPIEAAPTPPSRNAEDVVSIFSDAYTDVTLDELPTKWSLGGFEAVNLNNDNVWKLTNVDFIGMVTNYGAGVDLSSMEMMHIDYWVPEGVDNELSVKIVNTVDTGEDIESLGTTVTGTWQSIDIDMTGFDGDLVNKEKITQLLIDSEGIAGVVYIDNFYFYKAPTSFAKVFDDFEGNGTITTWAEDKAGLDIAFANPFVDATNGSATVLKYEDTGGQYANIRFDVTPNFDFSVKKTFSLKVYVPSSSVTGSAPNQVSLKLQDNTNSEPWKTQTEIIKPIQLDTWQILTFDFENDVTAGAPNPLSRTDFNRVILQVNGENNYDNVVAYFDDVEWGDDLFVGPIPFDDFEGNGNITTWVGDVAGLNTSFANPLNNSDNSSATVLEYDDTGGGQYANIRFDNEANANFNMDKHTFSLKIYVPSSSVSGTSPNQISLKLQDNTNGKPWETQTEVIKSIELDKWQTVVFDFKNDTTAGSSDPLTRTNFNRVVLQVNGENNNDPVKAYIDDFKYY
ncbi:MAG: hypothetical protein ABF263_01910 [Polaribacter sp.]